MSYEAPSVAHPASSAVTPAQEQEEIFFELAGRPLRFLAALIDGALVGAIALASHLLVQRGVETAPAFAAPLVLLIVGVQAQMLVTRGQSIGKRVVGIRIVDEDGSVPRPAAVLLLRTLIPWLLSAIPYAGGLFWLGDHLPILGDERRCLHDHLAGTRVVLTST